MDGWLNKWVNKETNQWSPSLLSLNYISIQDSWSPLPLYCVWINIIQKCLIEIQEKFPFIKAKNTFHENHKRRAIFLLPNFQQSIFRLVLDFKSTTLGLGPHTLLCPPACIFCVVFLPIPPLSLNFTLCPILATFKENWDLPF